MEKLKKRVEKSPKHGPRYEKVQAKYLKGEVTLDRMRQAAIQEISEKGYHRTSVCEIVRRAKLTRGAFYNYWNTLDECIIDIIHSVRERAEKDATVLDLREKTSGFHPSVTVQKIVLILTMVLKKNWRAGYVILALLQEKDIPGKQLQKRLREYVDSLQGEWVELIAQDQKSRMIKAELNKDEVAAGIMNFIGTIIHLNELKYMDLRELQMGALRIFLNAILSDSARKSHPLESLIY